MEHLLAVDMGLKTGLALYNRDGRLVWYRSQHYPAPRQLKSAVYGLFKETPDISRLVIEGGGPLADIWIKEARRRHLAIRQISAETWRKSFLYPRKQRSGSDAKAHAMAMARNIIQWSGARRPTSLRHDAAEAILAGLWGVIDAGWLAGLPKELGLRS